MYSVAVTQPPGYPGVGVNVLDGSQLKAALEIRGTVKIDTMPPPIVPTRVLVTDQNDSIIHSMRIDSFIRFLNESFIQIPVVTVYSSSAIWNKPPHIKYIVVEVVGGGGGGGAASTTSTTASGGGGGGGGGYTRKVIPAADLGLIETVIVGAGGVGGTVGGDGMSGGASSFGTHCFSTGGVGGQGTNTGGLSGSGGEGGMGFNGNLNTKGQGGSAGDAGGGVGITKSSGSGGCSFFGGGAESFSEDGGSVNGANGGQYGGGGSGGYDHPSSIPASGGTGASGVIIITEYY